jgi:hypothetical protein
MVCFHDCESKENMAVAQLFDHLPKGATGARTHIHVPARSLMEIKYPYFAVV